MESARISRLVSEIRCCDASIALKRAQAVYGTRVCPGRPTTSDIQTPLESDLLASKVACLTYVNPTAVYPNETQRIKSKIAHAADLAMPYMGPKTLPVCPPTPTAILNAHLPKPSTRCPLPNKPNMPIFPV